jgi:energy-coupling factor transport system permease protein
MYHTCTWIVWLAAVVVALSSTRNPLYLILILLILLLQNTLLTAQPGKESSQALYQTGTPFSPFWFLLLILATSTLFNGLSSHFGETVILVIPGKIPLLSGPATLESLVYGLVNGLVLSGLLSAFSIINTVLPMRSLVHLIPQVFYSLSIVTSIAITFVPATRRQLDQVREAQAIRGHRLRGVRDWTPLAMPLLIGGLERALQLAETMTSRGFAGWEGVSSTARFRLGMLVGLAMILAGAVLRVASSRTTLENILFFLGVVIIFGALWLEGRQKPRTTYRREIWRVRDTLAILGVILFLAFFTLELPGIDHQVLSYNPYPQITLPVFDPLIGLATLGLLFPGLISFLSQP